MSKSKVLVGLTGSIACYKTCSLLSHLVKAGHDVQVIATASALKFVGEATLEGLTRRVVRTDIFSSSHMMEHISLARWADLFIVAPLSAGHLNKFALGLADDLLTTVYLAYEKHKPLFLAPAMNSVMYAHETVQESLKKLQERGAKILEPTAGILACGEDGLGKMMDPEEIFKIVFNESAHNHNNGKASSDIETASPLSTPPNHRERGRLLITFGGTREIIDGVRFITNLSGGRTGAQLTDSLADAGYEVTALAAHGAQKPSKAATLVEFSSHDDLLKKMKNQLETAHFDGVIHLAAVSDFSVDKIITAHSELTPSPEVKISSEESIVLKLKPNVKIVNSLKNYSLNSQIKVIAFKLTNTLNSIERSDAINKLLNSTGVDYVVHNDLNEMNSGLHPFRVYGRDGEHGAVADVKNLSVSLQKILSAPKQPKPSFRFEVSHDSLS